MTNDAGECNGWGGNISPGSDYLSLIGCGLLAGGGLRGSVLSMASRPVSWRACWDSIREWQTFAKRTHSVGQFPPLPHVILYGVDPNKPGMLAQQFDADGIAITALGDVKGDSAIFGNECANRGGALSCVQILRIRVPPNAESIDMAIDLDKIMISRLGWRQGSPTGQRIELKRQR